MDKYDFSWIPDDYKIDPRSLLLPLYRLHDHMRANPHVRRLLDVRGFAHFIEAYENVIKEDIFRQKIHLVPTIDFDSIFSDVEEK